MDKTWLLQRLKPPFRQPETPLGKFGKALAFGGGLKNGGLSAKAMDMLGFAFSFDYMGSSEFEWGAVPECLDRILQKSDSIMCSSFVVHFEHRSFRDEQIRKGQKRVFYICLPADEDDVKSRIAHWAMNYCYGEMKEAPTVNAALAMQNEVRGWIDLTNDFFVFSDETMWRHTCELFGIRTPSQKTLRKMK